MRKSLIILALVLIPFLLNAQTSAKTNNIEFTKRYKWNTFVKENGIPISFLKSDSSFSFQFLKSYLGETSIIFLGEQSHCCKEFNMIKGEMVKFLNQQMDFEVIAFESPMNSYCLRNLSKNSLSIDEFMIGTWNTFENTGLFKYIKDSMELAGIDLIPQYRSQYLKQLFLPIDTNLAKFCGKVDYSISELDQVFLKNTKLEKNKNVFFQYEFFSQDSLLTFQRKANELLNLIDSTKIMFDKNKDLLNINDKTQTIVAKSIENKKTFVQYLLNKHNWIYRDSVMGQNLKWLTEQYYLNNKMIVWAANGHITTNGVLAKQLNEHSRGYHVGIFDAYKTSPELFTSDAIFIDLSRFQNVSFTRDYYNYLKKNYDAVILVKKTTSCEPKYHINKNKK